MIVYIVLHCFDYGSCDVVAVFSSKEKAEKCVAGMEVWAGQSQKVEEWVVDGKGGE